MDLINNILSFCMFLAKCWKYLNQTIWMHQHKHNLNASWSVSSPRNKIRNCNIYTGYIITLAIFPEEILRNWVEYINHVCILYTISLVEKGNFKLIFVITLYNLGSWKLSDLINQTVCCQLGKVRKKLSPQVFYWNIFFKLVKPLFLLQINIFLLATGTPRHFSIL